ncbi:uncharacterized protein LOC118511608 [Anopheles stephensi]|uniref:uncharacterized protein LOC118511608 n=1 Tax=Anopheles stephensi TaxID=30069 RepID=UPI0016587AA3|nr:uncharacterized protein LOC118511608 [Anopheles stephensi]
MFGTICRLCFKELDPDDPDIHSILEKGIQKALKTVFPFEIWFAEDLPMYTCKQCSWNVLDFYCYSELVQKNQETLESKLLQEQKVAQKCYDMETTDKENAAPNIAFKPEMQLPDTNVADEHLIICKTELDDVLVANELHPDWMDYSFEYFNHGNTSITCEEYKITADVYDNATENCEPVPEDRQTIVAQEREDEEMNTKQMPTAGRAKQKRKRKVVKKSHTSTSIKVNAKRRTAKTNESELSCPECDRTFPNLSSLRNHEVCHVYDTCVVCKKSLRQKSMRNHMLRAHSTVNRSQEKQNNYPIGSKQKKKSIASVQKT